MSSTVNQSEVEKFKQMSSDWWNPNGVCKPLHSMNRLRFSAPCTDDLSTAFVYQSSSCERRNDRDRTDPAGAG